MSVYPGRSDCARPARLECLLAGALDAGPRAVGYVAAYSGGADSLALLAALVELRASRPELRVRAVHVDHGLSPDSREWSRHCGAVCAALDVELRVRRVDARPRRGESPEEAARRARYRGLEAELSAGEAVLTAHHRDDQAETVLLALARGSGPAGLAGMAPWHRLGRAWLGRPFLDAPRSELARRARATGLDWIEDPANQDLRHARSFLRARIVPELERHWPGLAVTLARVAKLQSESLEAVEALARIDLARLAGPGDTLSRAACLELGGARLAAALRLWLESRGLAPPAARHLRRIERDVVHSREEASPRVSWPGGEVRCYRDRLHAMRPLASVTLAAPLQWRCEEPLQLPHGLLTLERQEGAGLRPEFLVPRLEVRLRRGGERCRPAGRGHSQTLKRLLQERGVPPWERGRVPLLYHRDRLVAVADLWVCEGFQAGAGEPGWRPRWEPGG